VDPGQHVHERECACLTRSGRGGVVADNYRDAPLQDYGINSILNGPPITLQIESFAVVHGTSNAGTKNIGCGPPGVI